VQHWLDDERHLLDDGGRSGASPWRASAPKGNPVICDALERIEPIDVGHPAPQRVRNALRQHAVEPFGAFMPVPAARRGRLHRLARLGQATQKGASHPGPPP